MFSFNCGRFRVNRVDLLFSVIGSFELCKYCMNEIGKYRMLKVWFFLLIVYKMKERIYFVCYFMILVEFFIKSLGIRRGFMGKF